MSKKTQERYKNKTEYFELLKETASDVDPYVERFIQNKVQMDENEGLINLLLSRYRFGKPKLRPAQVRLAYELVGGKGWRNTIPACAALEVKDTGYYCFDEILDSEKSFNLMVLGGIFSSISYSMINDLYMTCSPMQVQEVFKEMLNLDLENSQAALIDLTLKNHSCKELYMKKAKGYNFWKQALRIGGILGCASEKELDLLGRAGQHIGTAHIIANDTWDFGKNLEDFRAGKYTLPIIWAFENTTSRDRRKLESLLGRRDINEKQADTIRSIMVKSGSIEYGKNEAKKFCDKGISLLKSFPDVFAKKMLEFSTTWTQRNKHYDILEKFK